MEEIVGLTSASLALKADLQAKKTRKVGSVAFGDQCATLRLGSDSLWAIVEGKRGSGIALRCAWAPGPSLELRGNENGEIELASSLGVYRVRIDAPSEGDAILHVVTTLTPTAKLDVPWWPRDLYVLGPDADPAKASGEVFAAQRGFNTGLLYARLGDPLQGTLFYLQDLTALNPFYEAIGAKPDGVVGGQWPELGYQPPLGQEGFLPEGEEIVISSAYLRLDAAPVDDRRSIARGFLDHQAAIYPLIVKEEPEYRDWPSMAEATLRDLSESPLVTIDDGGYRYVRPYVDAEYPDSMVQLTVLRMLADYGKWRGEMPPLAKELRDGVYRFFDPEIGAVHRYLNTVGEDKEADVVDSWYLYHPLMSLAHLAKVGDEGAKTMFTAALDYGIEVAHCFDYQWPIQFSLSSLMITTASREPGQAVGQTDAGGLYAYVMMEGYDLTGEKRYLEEAQAALRATAEMRFDLVYQTNLTSWGTAACLRVYRATQDDFFLDQASVFLASFVHNCAIWESDLGRVREARTFFGVSCLHNGPYLAPYECYESFMAFHECFELGEAVLPESHKLLLAEFIRYAYDRAWWFYPSSLKETSIARFPRNGEISRELAIPLEDLYVNGDPAGQVGQEVYGAGSAMAYAIHGFHSLEEGRLLFCEYPVRDLEVTASGASFTVRGPQGGVCAARLMRVDGATVTVDGQKVESAGFQVPVDAKVTVRWAKPSKTKATGS